MVDKDGNVKDSVGAGAGTVGHQIFRGANQRQVDSLEPLEEGLYNVGSPVSSTREGEGALVIPLNATFTSSTPISSIHVDANRKNAPGSLGSIAVYTLAEFNKLKGWIASNNITKLRTHWGINTSYDSNIVKEVINTNNIFSGFIIPTKGTYTSPFGPRGGRNHNGVDIANYLETPIYAFCSWHSHNRRIRL